LVHGARLSRLLVGFLRLALRFAKTVKRFAPRVRVSVMLKEDVLPRFESLQPWPKQTIASVR
jgi:hypothetical protein